MSIEATEQRKSFSVVSSTPAAFQEFFNKSENVVVSQHRSVAHCKLGLLLLIPYFLAVKQRLNLELI
jgi:hypothetical protein